MPSIFNRKNSLLIFLLTLSHHVNAELVTLEEKKIEDPITMKEQEVAALMGDSETQVKIASMYDNGTNGVKKDGKVALYWYEISARNGNALAQNILGYFYIKGENVTKDEKKAFEYFKQSALSGNSSAQANLGKMYISGIGIEKNYEQAFYWFKKASDQGSQTAPFYIAFMFENGFGAQKSLEQAEEWYQISLNRGYQPAKEKLLEISTSNPNNSTLLMLENDEYNQKLKGYTLIKEPLNKSKTNNVKKHSKILDSKEKPAPSPKKTYQAKQASTKNSQQKRVPPLLPYPTKPLVGIDRFSK